MGLCSFTNEIVLMNVVCYFGPYPLLLGWLVNHIVQLHNV